MPQPAPSARKYGYWVGTETPARAEDWLEHAEAHDGSWWLDWKRWVSRYNAKKVPARVPGEGGLDVIEDAPGAYVKARYD